LPTFLKNIGGKMAEQKKLLSVRINTMSDKTIIKGKNKYKGLKDQTAHNQRTEKMDDNYLLKKKYDHLNIFHDEVPLSEIQNIWEDAKSDYKEHYKRGMPSNAKPYLDGLITFSATMFDDMLVDGKLDREEMMEAVKGFLKEEYGKSFINVQLHTSETTPHYHYTIVNYDFDNKLAYSSKMRRDIKNSADVEKGIYKKNELQDRFADYMTKSVKGFDYERGAVHSIKAYHDKRKAQQEHLTSQGETIKEQEQTIEKHLDHIADLVGQLGEQKEEIVGLQAESITHEQQVDQLSAQIKDLEGQADNLSSEVIADIETILNDLIELDRTLDGQKFMEKIKRYVKSDNKEKMQKLIEKWARGLQKAKGRKNKGMMR
jgi:hypothetical protein